MATTQYVYPNAQVLRQIEQDLLPVLVAEDPIFDHFPIEADTDDVLRWEQLDNYRGLQQIRGLNGDPPKVARVGAKGYLMEPGYYGEHIMLDERELTKRRRLGTFGDRIDVTDLVRQAQEQMITRELALMRYVLWTLVSSGTFSISTRDGVVEQTDTFPIQTFTASPAWGTVATATPLADFRAVKLLGRGHSVSFGRKAKAYGNQVTINNMLGNTNAADLGGKKTMYGATLNSLADENKILLENDLPQIEVMDDGYYDHLGAFQLFIPNGKMVVIGPRPNGRPAGNYRMTYNANGNAPGSYMKVIDDGEDDVPRRIAIHRGHNGGPVIYFPSSVVVMNV